MLIFLSCLTTVLINKVEFSTGFGVQNIGYRKVCLTLRKGGLEFKKSSSSSDKADVRSNRCIVAYQFFDKIEAYCLHIGEDQAIISCPHTGLCKIWMIPMSPSLQNTHFF